MKGVLSHKHSYFILQYRGRSQRRRKCTCRENPLPWWYRYGSWLFLPCRFPHLPRGWECLRGDCKKGSGTVRIYLPAWNVCEPSCAKISGLLHEWKNGALSHFVLIKAPGRCNRNAASVSGRDPHIHEAPQYSRFPALFGRYLQSGSQKTALSSR